MRAALSSGLRGWLVGIWLLMTPLDDPMEWVWTIIGAYETGAECEVVRSQRLDRHWVVCALLRG